MREVASLLSIGIQTICSALNHFELSFKRSYDDDDTTETSVLVPEHRAETIIEKPMRDEKRPVRASTSFMQSPLPLLTFDSGAAHTSYLAQSIDNYEEKHLESHVMLINGNYLLLSVGQKSDGRPGFSLGQQRHHSFFAYRSNLFPQDRHYLR